MIQIFGKTLYYNWKKSKNKSVGVSSRVSIGAKYRFNYKTSNSKISTAHKRNPKKQNIINRINNGFNHLKTNTVRTYNYVKTKVVSSFNWLFKR